VYIVKIVDMRLIVEDWSTSKDMYKEIFKKKMEAVEDKILDEVETTVKEKAQKVEDSLLSGADPAIKDIVKKLKS
jgi:hypothetical protein